MADVRANAGVPSSAAFGGTSTPTPCSPLVFDSSTGDLYVLLAGDIVTKVGSIAGGAEFILAGRAFNERGALTPGAVIDDAENVVMQRVFRHAVRTGGWAR